MNLYATLDAIKAGLNVTSTARDSLYLQHLEAASRKIDLHCGRAFYLTSGVRYFDSRCNALVYVDDYVSLSALAMDSELDGTFDGETWAENTDWVSLPYNTFPKFGIQLHPSGGYAFTSASRYIKATGQWGYGDGLRAAPWDAKVVTATIATTGGTTLTLSVDDIVEVGHTVLIESEQMYVSAVATGTATVVRGVNGTTAATHSAAAVSVARYPACVERACVTLAISGLSREGKAGMKTERIGDYSYTIADEGDETKFMERALAGLVRPI